MNKLPSFLFAGVLMLSPARACINFQDASLDGTPTIHTDGYNFTRTNMLRHEAPEVWQGRREKLLASLKTHPATWSELSDLGGVLVHLGEYENARQVLEAAEKLEAGHSAVASNLGTAYELLGDNERARAWIAIGIKRNPKDHDGTEWLHLRILEVKLALAQDPKWLENNRVLGKDVNHGSEPRPQKLGSQNGRPLLEALGYQLQERLQFVKAPEPIVGELLFAMADEVALMGAVNSAVGVYEFAEVFKPVQSELLQKRLAFARAAGKVAAEKGPPLRKGAATTR